METATAQQILKGNSYPGRGIIIGRSEDDKKAIVVYFIMGRSVNSRNRIFTETEDGIRTEAFDPTKMADPSLIIYRPVRVLNGEMIVTNGDQTDTIHDFLKTGDSFENALMTREFEPDKPNYTPRISGLVHKDGSYTMSILKSNDGDPSCCCRYFFDYAAPKAGEGRFIHTYKCDGDPIPSFEGEPEKIEVSGDLSSYAETVWSALDADNKVSLYAAAMDIESGKIESIIINKNH